MSSALRPRHRTSDTRPNEPQGWTFLTNHSHVLVCLHRNPNIRLRDVAEMVGVTERAVQRIVLDLEKAGVISRQRKGRRNVYEINAQTHLRHRLEGHRTVADLLDLAAEPSARRAGRLSRPTP
ncbi:MAG TPA: winged helix-turn-helix domain-containing protein [Phycisphaerales bacterium]|nr:winged helix-turn-helix domain-containing protein [Phycisphaerales bacterium]